MSRKAVFTWVEGKKAKGSGTRLRVILTERKTVDLKGRRLDLLGAEGRMLGFKVLKVKSGVPRSTDLHKKRKAWYSVPDFAFSGSARSCVGGVVVWPPGRGLSGVLPARGGARREPRAAGNGRCFPVP